MPPRADIGDALLGADLLALPHRDGLIQAVGGQMPLVVLEDDEVLKSAQAGAGVHHLPGRGGPNRRAGGDGEVQALAGAAEFPSHGA